MSGPSVFIATDEWLESRLLEGMYAHQGVGFEEAASLCRARAGEIFVAGKDDKLANYLREMAVDLDKRSKDLRRQQRKQEEETAKLEEPRDAEAFPAIVAALEGYIVAEHTLEAIAKRYPGHLNSAHLGIALDALKRAGRLP